MKVSYVDKCLFLDPPRHLVDVEMLVISSFGNGLPDVGPACHDGALGLGANDGESGLAVRDEAVHEALLDQRRHRHLDVLEGDLCVAPHHALVGTQLLGSARRGSQRRVGRVPDVVGDGLDEQRVRLRGGPRAPAAAAAAVAVAGMAWQPAFQPALQMDGDGVQVRHVQRGCFPGRRVRGGHICQDERLASQRSPEHGTQSVRQRQQHALFEQPWFVRPQVSLELDEVSRPHRLAERREDGLQGAGLGSLQEKLGGEPAEEHVAGDEVREDVGAVGDELRRRLQVGLLEAQRGAVVVLVGEVETTQVVEKCDALGGRVKRQREGEGGNVDEEHLGEVCSSTLVV